MTDECIAFFLPDGTVRYATCPAKGKRPGETKSQWLARVFSKTVADNPPYAGATRIANPLMPDGSPLRAGVEKMFFGAWKHSGGGRIVVDMPAARAIKMNEIRAKRDALLSDPASVFSDAMYLRAQEIGDAPLVAELGMKRQQLRDIPNTLQANGTLEAIATPEELQAFETAWPTAPA